MHQWVSYTFVDTPRSAPLLPPPPPPQLYRYPPLTQTQYASLQPLKQNNRSVSTVRQVHPVLHSSHLLSTILSYCTIHDLLTSCTLVDRSWYNTIHTHCSQIVDPTAGHYLRIGSLQALDFLQHYKISSITATNQTVHPHYVNFNNLIRDHAFINSVSIEGDLSSVLTIYGHSDPSKTHTLPQITTMRHPAHPMIVYESFASRQFCTIRLQNHGLFVVNYFAPAEFQRIANRHRASLSSSPLLELQHPYLHHLTLSVDFHDVQPRYAFETIEGLDTVVINGARKVVMTPAVLHKRLIGSIDAFEKVTSATFAAGRLQLQQTVTDSGRLRQYEFKDSQTGRTLCVEWSEPDTPSSHADISVDTSLTQAVVI